MIRGVLSHVVAILTSLFTLTLLPSVAYALLSAFSFVTEGAGGKPLNVILVPAAAFVGAASTTLLSLILTILIEWRRRRRKFGAWVPTLFSLLLGSLLGVGLGIVRGGSHLLSFAALGFALVGFAFNAYWIPFTVTKALLERRREAKAP